ncbi:hypothetical protein BIW11_07129 [Tropilaelaps mercedesae]|nr:hypothetical protein BIW11_07129 [Tropilaelaps mercedesae]
MPPKNRN